jgi:hypothetical protein
MNENGGDGAADGRQDALDSVDRGLDALVLVDVARDVLEAVDAEAFRAGAPVEEAFDHEQLRRALGGPVGRVVARRLADRVVGGGVTGLVGREVAGRAGAALVETVVDRADPDAVLAALESMAEEPTDRADGELTAIDINVDDEDDEER